MALIEQLLGEIDDPRLRAAIEAEVRQLKDRTEFGLVFERHLPESVLLASRAGIKAGEEVRVRTEPANQRRLWVTQSDGKTARVRTHTGEEMDYPLADLHVVKRFDEPIFPTLQALGSVRRGGTRSPHLAIEAENFHALQLLRFTHARKFDCIYIDPPYNTGARDWKYNNDFVDDTDHYRHSKWLSFIEKRLKLARELLRPDGVLIITIDENELHHLSVLLERGDLFRDALRQVVTICINPSGAAGEGLSRVEEYAVFCFLGAARPVSTPDDMLIDEGSDNETATHGVRWERLMRGGNAWYRASRPNLCYPVLLSEDKTEMVRAGEPWTPPEGTDDESLRPDVIDGHPVAWPVRQDGKLGIWRVQPSRLDELIGKGYAYNSNLNPKKTPTLRYLLEGTISAIEAGAIEVTGRGERGQVLVRPAETNKVAKTMWYRGRHTAGGGGGTHLLSALLGERNLFSFPKSVYAVKDCLDVAIGDRPNALILDFFAGSGTTLHATCLLNAADGGNRRCIVVTNNEVEDKRAKTLHQQGLFAGDEEFERHGVFRAATRPRIEAAVTGQRPDGTPAPGNYLDGRAISAGFEENVEFVRMQHLDEGRLEMGVGLGELSPLLWLAAAGQGTIPESFAADEPFILYPEQGYAVLLDDSAFAAFLDAVRNVETIDRVFLLTDYDDTFAAMSSALSGRTAQMVPRDYLRWFRRYSGWQS